MDPFCMKNEWLVPGAIIAAGILIAFAVYVTHHHAAIIQNGNPEAVAPVNPTTDHFVGNPTAPVVVIEYADIDSEYSKGFQQVMEQIMLTYGSTGQVAWVYRHFPLVGIDTNSEEHAEAAECVASLSNNSKFFAFIDALQVAAPGDSQFNPQGYDSVVSSLGISTGSFDDCCHRHNFRKKVAADYANGQAVGTSGTPFSVVLVKGQKPFTISGELPYDSMKIIIDKALAEVLASKQ